MTTKKPGTTLFFTFLISIFLLSACEQNENKTDEKAYYKLITDQRTKNYEELIDSTVSRFNKSERNHFIEKKPRYFEPNLDFVIDAVFSLDTSTPVFKMQTTTDRKPNYRIYGYVNFSVKDTLQKLTVYQNYDFKDHPEHGKVLFIPFMDNTNEFSSYGGGRYIDIPIPSTKNIQIDFNTAFNPYCAYADRWSCPMVPIENTLDVAILAGEKKYK